MADSGIVKHSDLFQENLTQPTIKEMLALMDVFDKTETKIKSFATTYKSAFTGKMTASYEDVTKLATESEKVNKVYIENATLLKEKIRLQEKLSLALTEEAQDVAALRVELEKVNLQNKQNAKITSESVGAYSQATAKLAQMTRTYKDLVIAGKESSNTAITFKKSLDELRASVMKADASVGDHRRNVGNYASGFNGLQNSINQVTREFPAFVNSAQTGFMAISNNLPILVDQIKQLNTNNAELIAQGKPAQSVFKSLAGAIFSWGSALSVGITLLTLYGKEIVSAIGGLMNFKNASDLAKESQASLNTEIERISENIENYNNSLKSQNDFLAEIEANNAKKVGATEKEIFEIRRRYANADIEAAKKESNDKYYLWTLANDELQRTKNSADEETLKINKENEKKLLKEALEAADVVTKLERKKGLIISQYELSTFEKSKELSKKAKEDAIKKAENDLKLQNELNEMLAKARLSFIEDELKRKEAEINLDLQMQSKANIEKYGENKKTNEINYAIAVEAERKIQKLRADAIEQMRKDQEEKDAINQKEFDDYFAQFEAEAFAEQEAQFRADERAKKAADQMIKEEQKTIQNSLNLLDNANKERNKRLDKQIDRELNLTKERQGELRQLAAMGIQDANNNLAFEEKREAELISKRQKLEERKRRQELATAAIKSYSANVEKAGGDGTALTKTLKDISVLMGAVRAIPAFYEGTEDTGIGGNADNKGGFIATLHPHERVVTEIQNKMIGDLSNNELATIANMYNNGLLAPTYFDKVPMSYYVNDNLLVNEMKSVKGEIKELQKIIDNKPVTKLDYDPIKNAVLNIEVTGRKTTITETKNKGGLFRG